MAGAATSSGATGPSLVAAARAFFRRYWPALLAALALVPHALVFDFVNDDAYISFRYAENLAHHGQLVFNLGERVEGFTNFLWTVLLALGIDLGVSPVVSSRFLGIVFAIGTLGVIVRLSLRLDGERASPAHLIAPLGLAATGAFACWCTGGLETQLFTFLATLAFDRVLDEAETGRGVTSALYLALAGMTRPEGLLLLALAGLYRLSSDFARGRFPLRRNALAWGGLFLLLYLPYFVWRWRYYGWLFPNTFYVKSSAGGQAATLQYGLTYLRHFAEDYGAPFFALIVLLGWPARDDRRRYGLFCFTALLGGTFVLYVLKVGGDFMGLYRFILPVVPLAALAVQEALRTLGHRLAPRVGRPAVALAGLVIAAGFVAGSAQVSKTYGLDFVDAEDGIDSPAYLKKYADDRVPIGLWFARYARPDDLMTVGGAGVIPYYSRIPAYDVFGLVDEHIAHDASMTVSARPGHQKWGSEAYMLSRHPTLITHKYCLGAPCEQEGWAPPGYEWVRAQIPGLTPPYYSFLKRTDRAFGPFPAHQAP